MKQCEKCIHQVDGDCLHQRVVLRKRADGTMICHPSCSHVFYEERIEVPLPVEPQESTPKSAPVVVKFTDETAQQVEALKAKAPEPQEAPKKTTPQKGRPPKSKKG